MRDTKFLFDEQNQTPEGMVSVSQLQTFMSCQKKWEYGYIENLTPRVERSYLTIGKLCHKGMQTAMQAVWYAQQTWDDPTEIDWDVEFEQWLYIGLANMRAEWDEYMSKVPLLDEEFPELEQTLKDAQSVFTQAFEEFEPWRYEVLTVYKDGKPMPALELHFVVPCQGSKGLHGYIDAILYDRETGSTWCTDYKFRRSLSPDEDEAYNIQNAVYSWACHKMKIPITGTMTWQHINTPASDPQILKNGGVSKAKIKTTWNHYKEFCEANGIDPTPYEEEMREKLSDIEWFRATYEYRNLPTVKNIWNECVVPYSYRIKTAYKGNNKRSLYPWNCKMCQYQSICQAELRGYDAEAIRNREYTKRR